MLRNLIEQMTRKRFAPSRKRGRQSRRDAFQRRLSRGLQIESLETRNLLAVTPLGGTTAVEGMNVSSVPNFSVEAGNDRLLLVTINWAPWAAQSVKLM